MTTTIVGITLFRVVDPHLRDEVRYIGKRLAKEGADPRMDTHNQVIQYIRERSKLHVP